VFTEPLPTNGSTCYSAYTRVSNGMISRTQAIYKLTLTDLLLGLGADYGEPWPAGM
jgi:hypothetical protein